MLTSPIGRNAELDQTIEYDQAVLRKITTSMTKSIFANIYVRRLLGKVAPPPNIPGKLSNLARENPFGISVVLESSCFILALDFVNLNWGVLR